MADELEQPASESPKIEPIWGVSAKVVEERPYGPGGAEVRRGAGKFSGGAKVYVAGVFWGPGAQKLMVIGHFWGGHEYITSGVKTEYLEKFRAELIYSPAVIAKIVERAEKRGGDSPPPLDGSDISKQAAQELATSLNSHADYWREKRDESRRQQQSEASEVGQPSDDEKPIT